MPGTSTDRVRTMDMPVLDKVFAMEDGWVLIFRTERSPNFSGRNFGSI